MNLPCITLWQPWASLIAYSSKRVENRSWKPPQSLIGKRIAIHAEAKYEPILCDEVLALRPEQIKVSGAVLCTARVCGIKEKDGTMSFLLPDECLPMDFYKWWDSGYYGWLLDHIQVLPIPERAKGHQRIWQWEVPKDLEGYCI